MHIAKLDILPRIAAEIRNSDGFKFLHLRSDQRKLRQKLKISAGRMAALQRKAGPGTKS